MISVYHQVLTRNAIIQETHLPSTPLTAHVLLY
jgi:hypothetical protein